VWLTVALLLMPSMTCQTNHPDEAELLAGADARIERHRKVDLQVTVLDADGAPLPNAQVTVEQIAHEFLFGCNIFTWRQPENPAAEQAYRQRFADLLNYATLPFYWWAYERERGRPVHPQMAEVADWCNQHGIRTKGHPLAWNYGEPGWLPDDPKQVATIQMDRIADCVATFAGKIDVWDVVNEAAAFDRPNMRGEKLTAAIKALGRSEFVRQAFATARRANPKAVLLINDYEVGSRYEQVIRELVDGGGRRLYDTIGIQSHMHRETWPLTRVWTVCERFAAFGVPLHFTELTVLSGAAKTDDDWFTARSGWDTTPEGERAQADYVEKLYRVLFSHPSVEAITWWDFSDYHAWQGAPAGLLRKDQSPKPVYERLLKLVKDAWWTREAVVTQADGTATLRVFRARHRVTAQGADGARATTEITAAKDQPNRVILRVGKVR